MNDSFDYLMSKFLFNYCKGDNAQDITEINLYNDKRISDEFRKILDKIALKIIYSSFESEDFIQAIILLNRIERIIVVFGVILGMSNSELAFLLNTNKNSVYVQKCKAIKKLKKYITDNYLF